MNALIQPEAITKSYLRVIALDSVDFELLSGEVHIRFAENSVGTSTLFSMLAGSNSPRSGVIRLTGKAVSFFRKKMPKIMAFTQYF